MIITDLTLHITEFAFVLMRMTGLILTNPLIGRRNLPTLWKAGFILALSILIFTTLDVRVPEITSFPVYVLLLLKEFICGFAIGLAVNIYSYVISFAGELMDMQMGLSMATVYDPGSNISRSTSGNIYNIMFIMTFFLTDAYLNMIKLFLDSSLIVPYGEVVINTQLTEVILDMFCECSVLGLKMAVPLVFLELLLEVAVGVMMKAVPQINIFIINIQLKMILGMVLMIITFQPMGDFIESVVEGMFGSVQLLFTTMGG